LHRLVHPVEDDASRLLRKEVRRLAGRLAELEAAQERSAEVLRRADQTSTCLHLAARLDGLQHAEVDRLPALLDEERIARHVRCAIAAAPLLTDPYEHMVVERVLPDDVYELLLRAIPPPAFFNDRDPIKQDVALPMEFGPRLSLSAWNFVEEVIARRIIRPAVLEKFHEPLQRHFALVFGDAFVERANAMPESAHGGRLMLRRPGYHLSPHRDPKRVMLTCLMYLARPGDNEEHGTQIFRVRDDGEAGYKQTYYPGEDGRRCELVKVVPYRPNTMLVNLNSQGAHGATIPADAPADLERYTYQFYVAPQNDALSALIKALPKEQRAMWRNKAHLP
jgi:hypothetical protein